MSSIHLAAGSKKPPLQAGLMRCYNMTFCPYAQRTRIVLAAKNVKHDIVNINLKNKPEWYLKINPLGKVPALEKDGQLMYESLVTCDYLDEAYPDPPLYPADPWAKAQDRMFMEVLNKVALPMVKIYFAGGDRDIILQNIVASCNGLDLFEVELTKRNKKFFGGATPGMLDYMIWPWAERVPMIQLLAGDKAALLDQRFPKMLSWMECMKQEPAVQATWISPNTHLKFLQERPNGVPNYEMEDVHPVVPSTL